MDNITTFDDEERVSCCPAPVAAVVDTVVVKAIDCQSIGKGGVDATLSWSKAAPKGKRRNKSKQG